MLSRKDKDIVASTLPVLAQKGEQITRRFYQLLFESHPELLNLFNQANQHQGRQQTALAQAIYAAAAHLDDVNAIRSTVVRIAEKHRALGVQPEQYPIVGETLLLAMRDVLGSAATPEILDAWARAYGQIADAFITVEAELYKQAAEQVGGWQGERAFVVRDKVKESDVITSFYLEPQDGGPVAQYAPGQYLTVVVRIPGHPYVQRRHYSLSDAPGKPYYRISVKREAAIGEKPAGLVSNYLHDHVHIGDILYATPPAGDFRLDLDDQTPVVFLSGGVGMTPLMSMVEAEAYRGTRRRMVYVHSALSGAVHAFDARLRELAQQSEFTYHVVYERPSADDRTHPYLAKEGFVDRDLIEQVSPAGAVYAFCGPTPFMRTVYRSLREMGVPDERIRFEFFGPTQQLLESEPVGAGCR
ncbi:NO-inducible flavohemoprotein [Alicyclobacillus mali (ex Roth et al. 2021)]|uniref:NO-inducible flavohemoprotein n=1 Tax=Alicyclobacillus mali (ex Roth et al. 2021) TaxID=1123961 RepID=UPI001A8EFEF1|nr:NO-inducible flavohemoprotein [Alicyclobacillus mali (ex Roth et al. 2021)]